MLDTAIYIHIPFCDHKCIYCDFYSIITCENTNSFLDSIQKEILHYSAVYKKDRRVTSIFFGGGTPSLMQPKFIGEILSAIKHNFSVYSNSEITLETNPGTVDKSSLREFLNSGINRLSIGIQSFDDEELKFLTRIHDSRLAEQTVRDAAEIGFENLSIDLIFNLPGQTKEKWLFNLAKACSLPVKHISAYSLILEKGTILNKMVIDGKVRMQDDNYDADLYSLTIDYLTGHNFEQYEVSNFAKTGYQCIHNKAYWRYQDYMGFGPSAHSFVNGKRWWNYSSLKFYINAVEEKNNAVIGYENLTHSQKLEEYTMLALRSSGIDLDDLKNKFGTEWQNNNQTFLRKMIDGGYINQKDNFIKFTPKGFLICDEILAGFK